MKRFNAILAACLGTVLLGATAQAAWTAVETFDSLNLGQIVGQDGWGGSASATYGKVVVDPANSGNQVVAVSNGFFQAIWKPLPTAIPDGSVATVFFRFRYHGEKNSIWGLSDTVNAMPGTWRPLVCMNTADGSMQGFNGTTTGIVLTNSIAAPGLLADEWHSMWFVLNTTSDTAQYYLDGGILRTANGAAITDLLFRNGTPGSYSLAEFAIKSFNATLPIESQNGTMYFDDIYLDTTGANLSSPVLAPSLTIRPSGSLIVLSWPSSLTGSSLQYATNLAPPINWNTVTDAPSLFQGQNVVSNVVSGKSRFYRLIGATNPAPETVISWNDPRIFHRESADRTFASHDNSLVIIGPNTEIGSNVRMNLIPADGLKVTGGTRNMMCRVLEDPANEGVTRNWFKLRISNNCPTYGTGATESTIRIGIGGGYRNIPRNTDVWQMISFVFDGSLYENMGGRNDTSISGLHQVWNAGQTLTPMTLFADPVGTSGLKILWVARRWNPPDALNPAGNPSQFATSLTVIPTAVKSKRYTIITHYRWGWNTGSGPDDVLQEVFAQVNGVWVNNGSAIYTFNGAKAGLSGRGLGFNNTDSRLESRGFALYNWANTYNVVTAWPDAANGAAVGFPAGDKCWMSWYNRVINMYATPTAGLPAVNQFTLAATANAASF